MTRKRPFDLQNAKPSRPLEPSLSAGVVPHAVVSIGQRVREILERKKISLFQLSQASRKMFPNEPSYHIPHNLYFDLRSKGFAPSIHQLVALSALSGYALSDWLGIFGFHLDDISRLQISLPFQRTTLPDTNVYNRSACIPWFTERLPSSHLGRIVPLVQMLAPTGLVNVADLLRINRNPFVYAKVGLHEVFAYPELLPGSIVRADPRNIEAALASIGRSASQPLFLVEHSRGLNCCRLKYVAPDRVVFTPVELPGPHVELRLGIDLKILGMIDMEIRNVQRVSRPGNHRAFDEPTMQDNFAISVAAPGLHALLRRSRSRAGLSFREASALSRKIAAELGDEQYFTAGGTLSDYETSDLPPRRIQKIITLCILYSIGFWQFLKAARLSLNELGNEAIPDGLAPTVQSLRIASSTQLGSKESGQGIFFRSLLEQFEEIPFFLHPSLAMISGLPRLSLRDVFWAAGEHGFHGSFEGTQFLIVNRRIKKPAPLKWEPLVNQPLYLLTARDGSYFCARFNMEGKSMLLHRLSTEISGPRPLPIGLDTEIVGQIVNVVRRISAKA
jgi:transcriptional regulator with XRE-family HTH domain